MRSPLRLVVYLGILSLTVWGVGRYGYDRSQEETDAPLRLLYLLVAIPSGG